MSIVTVENKFPDTLLNFFVSDFVIDAGDATTIFNKMKKYTIYNPVIKINVINLEEKGNLVSSFTLYNKELFNEDGEFTLIDKLEIDNCQVLLLGENKLNDTTLDEWLEKCISIKELYNVEPDGKMCITSGFGPGVYNLMGIKVGEEVIALRMEFIKEKID